MRAGLWLCVRRGFRFSGIRIAERRFFVQSDRFAVHKQGKRYWVFPRHCRARYAPAPENKRNLRAMNLGVYNFFGKYESHWNLVFADILLTIIPVIALYLLGQRYIISGMAKSPGASPAAPVR